MIPVWLQGSPMMRLNVGTGQCVFSVPADVGMVRTTRKTGGNKSKHAPNAHLTRDNLHVTRHMGNYKSKSGRKKSVAGRSSHSLG